MSHLHQETATTVNLNQGAETRVQSLLSMLIESQLRLRRVGKKHSRMR